MENQTISSKSVMLTYGAYMGLASILLAVSIYAMGKTYDQHWSVGVIGFIIMIAFIALGLKKFKGGNGGFLKLGEAIKIGLGISLISGLVYVVYLNLFITVIEPDYFTNLMAIQEQTWIDAGMDDDAIDSAKAMTEKFSNPMMTSAFTIIGSLFFGFIISLISGLIMKKSNEEITSI